MINHRFEWFEGTQRGDADTVYRWRGRNETTDRELNPKVHHNTV